LQTIEWSKRIAAIRARAAEKVLSGPNASQSQDFLYGDALSAL